MPLQFPVKELSSALEYTAAEIAEITVDFRSHRVLVLVVYGDIVDNVFVRNVQVPMKRHAIDAPALWAALRDSTSLAGVKTRLWNALVSLGKESGTEV